MQKFSIIKADINQKTMPKDKKKLSKSFFGFSEMKDSKNEIMIMKTGKWKHPVYGEFKITPDTLKEVKANFDSKVRKTEIGIDVEHRSYDGYVGWINSLTIVKNALMASVEWTKKGAEMVMENTFKYFSPEIAFLYEDMETQKQFTNVLIGGGITNRPYFKGLKPLLASESNAEESGDLYNLYFNNEKVMNKYSTLLASLKDKEKISKAEMAELTTAFNELTEDEKAEVETKPEAMEEKVEAEKAPETPETPKTETTPEVKASEAQAEIAKLSEENAKMKAQLRASEIGKHVDAVVCSEGETEKAFLPAAKDKITKFFEKLNDAQIAEFNEIVKLQSNSALFKEAGKSGVDFKPSETGVLNANATVEAKKLSEKEGIGFEEALEKIGYESIK